MKTRQDVLERMKALGACPDSFVWLHAQDAALTAEQLWDIAPMGFVYWFAERNQSKEVYDAFVIAHREYVTGSSTSWALANVNALELAEEAWVYDVAEDAAVDAYLSAVKADVDVVAIDLAEEATFRKLFTFAMLWT